MVATPAPSQTCLTCSSMAVIIGVTALTFCSMVGRISSSVALIRSVLYLTFHFAIRLVGSITDPPSCLVLFGLRGLFGFTGPLESLNPGVLRLVPLHVVMSL